MAKRDADAGVPGAAWQDRSKRHEDDATLRRFGFRVVARPARGEAVWERQGERLTAAAAIAWCREQLRSVET